MIAEALAQLAEYRVIEKPVLCVCCSAVLVEGMAEDERDETIDALCGDKIFYLQSERVCLECFEGDEFEAGYRRMDLDS